MPGWNKARSNGGYIATGYARRILERDNHTCYLCHQPATQVDHIVPWAEGGTHAEANLAAICRDCHAVKTKAEAARGVQRRAARGKRAPERHPGLTGGEGTP